jgi:hypothetical protein
MYLAAWKKVRFPGGIAVRGGKLTLLRILKQLNTRFDR